MVEILNGLTCGAFAKIVEAGDHDQSPARLVQDKADVTKIGARDVLQFGQRARGPDADHGASGIKLAIEGFDGISRLLLSERDVNRRKDAARERQEVRRKNELRLAESCVLENFRRVAMREKIVSFEVFVDFDELHILTRIFACAAGTGFAITDDVLAVRYRTGVGKRAEGEDNAGGVAAGIGDQARFSDVLRIQLGKAVDGFTEIAGVRRRQLVPGGKCFRLRKAEGAAQVNHAEARFEKRGSEFRGNFMRRGEKSRSRSRGSDRVERKRPERSLCPAAELRKEFGDAVSAVRFPHIKRSRGDRGMAQEYASQLKAGVSGDTNDGDLTRVSHFTRASIFFWSES